MTSSILTLDDLSVALEKDFKAVQEFLSKVTVEADLSSYLLWLYDNEVTTKVSVDLERKRRRAKGIHPSSASKRGVCLLKLYYECTFEVEPRAAFDQKMQLTWDVGTLLHETYQTWFRAIYKDQFKAEVPLSSEDGYVKSRTDGIFTFTDIRFILEAKSIKEGGNYGWETIQSKPMEDHVRQAHFYMWLADIPFALIFYMNKNAGEFKEHAVHFNQNLWDEIMDNVLGPVVDAAYLEGPEVPANPQWACRWCQFEHGCPERGGKDDDVDW